MAELAKQLGMGVLENLNTPHGYFLYADSIVPELEDMVESSDQTVVTSVRIDLDGLYKYICYVW